MLVRGSALDAAVERACALAESIDEPTRPRARLRADLLVCEALAAAGRTDNSATRLQSVLDRCMGVGLRQWIRDADAVLEPLITALGGQRDDHVGP
ncbi:hypothetical protein [Rhodococcus opacus]|uniref:hypothetical protein n=1 Tax=Rhodococcus opacus TaxID=37919 RepID=UPI0027DF7B29|nr:hypothetical protein [Rhodococcus opacus]